MARTPEERQARKEAAGLRVPVEPAADLLALSVEELNALSDELDARRRDLMHKKREVHEARCRRLAQEQAAYHGLSVEGYAAAKEQARRDNVPLVSLLGEARRLQVAKANPANVGARPKGKK